MPSTIGVLGSSVFGPFTVDFLVVAGGGGGGATAPGDSSNWVGGGGGGGGLRSSVSNTGGDCSSESPFVFNYGQSCTVTIGLGGVGALGLARDAAQGQNSIFHTITSIGGGYGGGTAGPSVNALGGDGGTGGGGQGGRAGTVSGGAGSDSSKTDICGCF